MAGITRARHTYADLYTLYEAERKTVVEQNKLVAELRATIDKLGADLKHREANDKLSQEAFKSSLKSRDVLRDRCQTMRQHIEIALRVLRRGKIEKKKAPALRRALAVLEAAMAEEKDHDWPAWSNALLGGAAAAVVACFASKLGSKPATG